MKPLIGITTGEIINLTESWSPVTYGQSHTYSDVIIRAGGIPVLLPITDDMSVLKQLYLQMDGLVFSGGNDVDPELYGETAQPKTIHVSKMRDSVEKQLMSWSLTDKKPLLAICRGMHLLNVVLDGSLYQDIRTDLPQASDHQMSSAKKDVEHLAHKLKVDKASRFYKIIESTTISANSHHHQAIKRLASDLIASAWSEDGLIEAVETASSNFVIGVQCHPESLQAVEPKWNLLFSSFVACSKPGGN